MKKLEKKTVGDDLIAFFFERNFSVAGCNFLALMASWKIAIKIRAGAG